MTIALIASLLARIVLVPVFAVSGFAKLADADRTREMLIGFGVGRAMLGSMAFALPIIELAIAVALLVPPAAFAGAVAASVVLALFTAVIAFHLSQGRRPACNCFGQISSAPIGPLTLARNAVLTGLALLIVAAGPSTAATWRLDEAFDLSPLEAMAGVAAVVALLLLLWIAAVQMAILRRLAGARLDARAAAIDHGLPGPRRGLPEGSLAPSFGLSDTRGDFITLEQLLAPRRPVILYFMKPDCPPCVAMAGEVDRWQRIHADVLAIVRITDGVAAIDHYALLQARGEVAQAYDCWGTPCAVLVAADGRIGSLVAQGAAAIRALVKRAAAGAATDGVRTA